MSHKVFTEGEQHILQMYLQGGTFAGPFYLGLGSGPIPTSEDATLADITEVTGTNYVRLPVNRDSTPLGWSVTGDTATAPMVTWQNLDTDLNWDPADYMFLTLSPTGTVAPNVLIAAVSLSETIVLEPNKMLRAIFKFRQL